MSREKSISTENEPGEDPDPSDIPGFNSLANNSVLPVLPRNFQAFHRNRFVARRYVSSFKNDRNHRSVGGAHKREFSYIKVYTDDVYICVCVCCTYPVGAINIGFTTVETSSIAPRVYVPRATGTSSKLHPSPLIPPSDDRGSVVRSNMYRRPVWFFSRILRRFSSLVCGRKKGNSDCVRIGGRTDKKDGPGDIWCV